MVGLFSKIKSAGAGTSNPGSKDSTGKKKDEPAQELTPLEKMLQNAGPIREDGNDKFFGLENFGNTCYCNSIVQALYYSEAFRENVLNYPGSSSTSTPSDTPNGGALRPKVNVVIREPPPANTPQKGSDINRKQHRGGAAAGQVQPGTKPEDRPDSPEYKKKQAMIKGPILELKEENSGAYGMGECTFTGMKDLFQALTESQSRTGVLSPQRFLEVFKRNNEMFQTSMHQDAHEFYGLVLNDIISNVEDNAKKVEMRDSSRDSEGLTRAMETVLSQSTAMKPPAGVGWVHDIFEGVLTSETKCLTCETASQRDETFLDLSIDLDEHSSVTSCLSKFSREEMLCEVNKFHCDHCGGKQEAEKRMKIHRLPKVLAFHLKRFKYTEDYTRLQKLFHRVVYPYYLRMFNTTDDADDADRLYELYAVVVHIGGNAYHGHYVSVIKTKDRGWVLFDDEMVEPVDKHFIKNFFGDKPGMACAYVLFYQETTFENIRAEQEVEGLDDILAVPQKISSEEGQENGHTNGSTLARQSTAPISPADDEPQLIARLAHSQTLPLMPSAPSRTDGTSTTTTSSSTPPVPPLPIAKSDVVKSKEDKKREKKEAELVEKARKAQAKLDEKRQQKGVKATAQQEERAVAADDIAAVTAGALAGTTTGTTTTAGTGTGNGGAMSFLSRSARGSKSMSKKSFGFLAKDKDKEKGDAGTASAGGSDLANGAEAHHPSAGSEKLKERFSFGLGKKKSSNVLS